MITQEDWQVCREALKRAKLAREALNRHIRECDERHGTTGEYRRMSSGYCESWPVEDQQETRRLSREANDALDRAFRLRPKGAHLATVRKLWHEMTRQS